MRARRQKSKREDATDLARLDSNQSHAVPGSSIQKQITITDEPELNTSLDEAIDPDTELDSRPMGPKKGKKRKSKKKKKNKV